MNNSIDALLAQKKIELQRNLEQIAWTDLKPFIHMELEKSIERNIYSRPESDSYERTRQAIESVDTFVVKKTSDSLDIIGNNNESKMNPSHTSWVSGEDVDKHIMNWLEYGHEGLASYEGSLSYAEAEYRIYPKIKGLIKRKLTLMGYKVK